MRKIYIIKRMLILLLAFQFTSCNNEPLEGEFLQDGPDGAEIGQFIATVEGQQFIAETAGAVLNEGDLLISGGKANGESIVISIGNAEEDTFDLGLDDTNSNFATYTDGPDSVPYLTSAESGGSGELTITSIDSENNLVSGIFNFKGVRIKLDSAGEPILDDDGMPVIEHIQIENGAFNSIPLMTLGDGEGKGNG